MPTSDIVSRKWIATLTSPEETSTQIEVVFLAALETEGLLELADQRATEALRDVLRSGDRQRVHELADSGQVPLLLAVSDNGSQMRSHSTREFLAGLAIATRFGRPHTPTDQAWIETLFGHVKTEWPHLEHIRDPGTLVVELDHVRAQYNGYGCTPPSAMSLPTTDTKDEVIRSDRTASTGSPEPASCASPTTASKPSRRTDDRAPALVGYFQPRLVH